MTVEDKAYPEVDPSPVNFVLVISSNPFPSANSTALAAALTLKNLLAELVKLAGVSLKPTNVDEPPPPPPSNTEPLWNIVPEISISPTT